MTKLKKILNLISQNKKTAAGIAVVIVIGFVVVYFNIVSENNRTSPYLKNREDQTKVPDQGQSSESIGGDTEKFIFLIKTNPLSGRNNSVNAAETLKFYFSDNIKLATLKLTVAPGIKIKTAVYPTEPNVLSIYPEVGDVWQNQVKYTISIDALESESGKPLDKPIKYYYQNVITRNLDWGESSDHAEEYD